MIDFRFLSLAENEAGNIDLKKSAVIIASHLDRLVQPHLPAYECSPDDNERLKSTKMYTLGLMPGTLARHGLQSATAMDVCGESLCDTQNTPLVIKRMCCTRENIHLLCDKGDVYVLAANRSNRMATEASPLRKLDGFGGGAVIDIQAHCEGNHVLALNADRNIFAWGSGEDGCLGQGDMAARKTPSKIVTLTDKFVSRIYAGIASSAAITLSGELYTWGQGLNGSLGHTSNEDKLAPCLVDALHGHTVMDVALGSGQPTLCVTDTGAVFAWGGCCGATQPPFQLAGLPAVSRVFVTSRIYVAILHDGDVFEWPRKYIERLCVDFSSAFAKKKMIASDDFENSVPKRLTAFDGRKVIDIAVGSAHCVALTSSQDLFGWGRNDFKQIAPTGERFIANPQKIAMPNASLKGLVCGTTSTIVFSHSPRMGLCTQEQYIVDLAETTFTYLDKLLSTVSYTIGNATKASATHSSGDLRPPPSQEMECIYVAALNLLRLQLYALQLNGIDLKTVGLGEGSTLLISLKTRIIALAGTLNVLKTIQDAAQWTLKVGWAILLPSVRERAQTLTSLLQSESGQPSAQYSFMTNLLVGSLMADDNLQIALKQAINSDPDKCLQTHSLPILHLVNQLLSNTTMLTQARLNQIPSGVKRVDDPHAAGMSGISLLHRFQRLLFAHVYNLEGEDLLGAESLLEQYTLNVVSLCVNTLTKAQAMVVAHDCTDLVANILMNDISDTLLYELLLGLVLLHCDKEPMLLQHLDWSTSFMPLIKVLDELNLAVLDIEAQNVDDLSWPGIVCRGGVRTANQSEADVLIRKTDLENHVLDGECWIVVNGDVYDVKDYR